MCFWVIICSLLIEILVNYKIKLKMIKLIAKNKFNGIKSINGVIAKGFSSTIYVPSIDEIGKYIQSN